VAGCGTIFSGAGPFVPSKAAVMTHDVMSEKLRAQRRRCARRLTANHTYRK
jgi:hypothetical protein